MSETATKPAMRGVKITEDNCVWLEAAFVKLVTDKAILLVIEVSDGGEVAEEWFPRTHVLNGDDYEPCEHAVDVGVSEWIFEQKGFLRF